MALITCPECSTRVSELASACPHCGAPISTAKDVASAGTPLATIQETSKKLKFHIIISAILFWGGLIMLFGNIDSVKAGESMSLLPSFAMMAGLIWYFVTRIRIWWHHK